MLTFLENVRTFLFFLKRVSLDNKKYLALIDIGHETGHFDTQHFLKQIRVW